MVNLARGTSENRHHYNPGRVVRDGGADGSGRQHLLFRRNSAQTKGRSHNKRLIGFEFFHTLQFHRLSHHRLDPLRSRKNLDQKNELCRIFESPEGAPKNGPQRRPFRRALHVRSLYELDEILRRDFFCEPTISVGIHPQTPPAPATSPPLGFASRWWLGIGTSSSGSRPYTTRTTSCCPGNLPIPRATPKNSPTCTLLV
mmetsp:Transcript_10095/g.29743  ORF Transcript_10095/g.29743 Transcript_10095/m.29743 type:complete len:200 (+) Transcript_10095:530-1129(+)